MGTLRYTREQLLEVIEARRPEAEQIDAQALAEHEKAKKAFLKEFRQACREGAKWDYETAKEKAFSLPVDRWRAPKCPPSMVASLDKHRNLVGLARQKTFVLSDSGTWSVLYRLLTFDPDAKPELC